MQHSNPASPTSPQSVASPKLVVGPRQATPAWSEHNAPGPNYGSFVSRSGHRVVAGLPVRSATESDVRRAASDKGIQNPTGANMCFLNVVVQALWHLPAFATRIQELSDRGPSSHRCRDGCLLCALARIFVHYQFQPQGETLCSAELRSAMAAVYDAAGKFAMGAMDDAVECFEALLFQIHCTLATHPDSCAPLCAVHEYLSMTTLQHVPYPECDCADFPIMTTLSCVQYIPSTYVLGQCPHPHKQHECFEICLRDFLTDKKACGVCRNKSTVETALLTPVPPVFAFGVVWERDSAESGGMDKATLGLFCKNVPRKFCLSKVFHSPDADASRQHLWAAMIGVICYYGKHYMSYFYSQHLKQWAYFDDSIVRPLGELSDALRHMADSRAQPTLIFYEVMATANAPVLPKHSTAGGQAPQQPQPQPQPQQPLPRQKPAPQGVVMARPSSAPAPTPAAKGKKRARKPNKPADDFSCTVS